MKKGRYRRAENMITGMGHRSPPHSQQASSHLILCLLDKPLVRLAETYPQDRIAVVYIRLAQLDAPCLKLW